MNAALRFAADCASALTRPIDAAETLALAVSGGADSMAMLALAAAAFPGRIVAATFDHGLRAGAAAEAAMVGRWCADAGIEHRVLHPDHPLPASNVQAAARRARYAALTRWAGDRDAGLLLTAHHADDQAETFLMRANRGSGLGGLAGVRPRLVAPGAPTILRPLLGWRRSELRAIATAAALPFVDDPSNADPRFDRVRMRDFLRNQHVLAPDRLARSAAWLAEAEADLAAIGEWLWTQRAVRTDTSVTVEVADLPRTLRRRLAWRAIDTVRRDAAIVRPDFSSATAIETLLDSLDSGRRATQAGVMVTPCGDGWNFVAAPPRKTG